MKNHVIRLLGVGTRRIVGALPINEGALSDNLGTVSLKSTGHIMKSGTLMPCLEIAREE